MPRRRDAEGTRQRLVEAAVELFSEKGVEATTLEEICTRAGFTRGAFYWNFKTKEELLAAALILLHERFFADEQEALPDSAGASEYKLYLDAGRREAETHWEWVRPLFVLTLELARAARNQPDLQPRLADFYRLYRGVRQRQIENILAAAGLEAPIPPETLASIAVAIEDGIHLQTLIDPVTAPPVLQFDALDFWIRILAAPPPVLEAEITPAKRPRTS